MQSISKSGDNLRLQQKFNIGFCKKTPNYHQKEFSIAKETKENALKTFLCRRFDKANICNKSFLVAEEGYFFLNF